MIVRKMYHKDFIQDLLSKQAHDHEILVETILAEREKIPCCGHACCCNLPEELQKEALKKLE